MHLGSVEHLVYPYNYSSLFYKWPLHNTIHSLHRQTFQPLLPLRPQHPQTQQRTIQEIKESKNPRKGRWPSKTPIISSWHMRVARRTAGREIESAQPRGEPRATHDFTLPTVSEADVQTSSFQRPSGPPPGYQEHVARSAQFIVKESFADFRVSER